MEITNAQYSAHNGNNKAVVITVTGEVLGVPLDPSNRHYAEILRQVETGELTIQEASD